jgi:glycosyltransferase involved in cell wall biosynthesis/GT2 family glycosyltransferase
LADEKSDEGGRVRAQGAVANRTDRMVNAAQSPDPAHQLRILFATARYLPERGGTEIHTHEVAQRLVRRGAEVTVACTSREPMPRESQDGDVRVVRVRAWPPNRDYYLAPALPWVIRANRTDLVHCQGYHTFVAPLAMLAALSTGTPYIVTLHSGGHSSALRRVLRPLQARLLRPLLVRAAHIVAVSQFEADLFARRLRLPRAALVVIPSGVDLPEPASGPPPRGDPLILAVGRVELYKGHQRIVQALPQLAERYPGVRFRVVGSGPYEDHLRDLAVELGVQKHLEIAPVAGHQRAEMARLLRAADAVVLLSEYESQGLAVQEAMALGRPLVVSAASGLSPLARHSNVRTVARDSGPDEIAAALSELLEREPAPAPPMPTWDECAAALEGLYAQALADPRNVRERFASGRFKPIGVTSVELSEPLAGLRLPDSYGAALVLVRLGGEPIGLAPVVLENGAIAPEALADVIWRELGTEIGVRLGPSQDGRRGRGMLLAGLAAERPVDVGARQGGAQVTVIVSTNGRLEQLDACLESLRRVDHSAFDVLVVDNCPSVRATRELVERHAGADARIKYTAEERRGVSVARNCGIAHTSSEIVAFVDDDVVVEERWLSELTAPFADDDRVAAVTGLVLPAELETRAQWFFERYRSFARGFEPRVFDLDAGRADARPPYLYWGGVSGSGTSMAFRRSDLLAIGGFDPALGVGSAARSGEDADVLSELVLRGHRLVYAPRAICWHRQRRDERALRRQLFDYGVGVTATLTKSILRRPSVARDLLASARPVASEALSSRAGSPPGLPLGLRLLALAGYVAGPVFYARSLRRARRRETASGA